MKMADRSHDSSSMGACEPLLDSYSADYPIRNLEDGQLRGCVYNAYNAGPRSRKDTVWSVSSLHPPALQLKTCVKKADNMLTCRLRKQITQRIRRILVYAILEVTIVKNDAY